MAALETPVALFIFNRPETTEQVFAAIRGAQPRTLLVIADGPRASRPEDIERCRAARAVVERVDWPCVVSTHLADENLGCGRRMASGLDWVFAREEEAIILEDDCVPAPSFFFFCQELLTRYRDDERVMMVGGDNFQGGISRTDSSYYFSKYVHTWGWATWRRAWRHFDMEMKSWPDYQRAGRLAELCETRTERRYWAKRYGGVYGGARGVWDYQWQFACWSHGGLTAVPERNLVSNVGLGDAGTHVSIEDDSINVPASDLWDIRHPTGVERSVAADQYMFRYVYNGSWRRAFKFVRRGFERAGPRGALTSVAQLVQLAWKALRG